ncbi:Os12g0543751 [Oryza sativa Japonica Group]|uniref:Os12g0543751 protein n=1 Tax=Oryza sativa subsp. japonica TaxID=39947 RepID=A0A0P0YB47_ORYSJ|nr:hypothetical protein EE612_060078 [Oryza sativa]BAT17524.1 Os12g0543751 [Oryza sativa Japonica Group]
MIIFLKNLRTSMFSLDAAHDEYFVLGLSCLQKVIAVSRMLSYGIAADAVDEYVRIGGSTVIESFNRFVVAIDEVFGRGVFENTKRERHS